MSWKAAFDRDGRVSGYTNPDTGEFVSVEDYNRAMQIHGCLQRAGGLSDKSYRLFYGLDVFSLAVVLPTLLLLAIILFAALRQGLFHSLVAKKPNQL